MNNGQKRKVRGTFERPAGSNIWWVRWHDAQGRRQRRQVLNRQKSQRRLKP